MPRFGTKSKNNLKTCDQRLQNIFKELLSAKYEKRTNRHTYKGLSLKHWEKYFDKLTDPSLPN